MIRRLSPLVVIIWLAACVQPEMENQAYSVRLSKHWLMSDYVRDIAFDGVDGEYTRWGVWSSQSLNHDPEWAPEKALNSLETLSFLKFAYHIGLFPVDTIKYIWFRDKTN